MAKSEDTRQPQCPEEKEKAIMDALEHFGMILKFGTSTGVTIADVISMLINSAISFWVFFPIMKWIFK